LATRRLTAATISVPTEDASTPPGNASGVVCGAIHSRIAERPIVYIVPVVITVTARSAEPSSLQTMRPWEDGGGGGDDDDDDEEDVEVESAGSCR
jgi:hypothetical protein